MAKGVMFSPAYEDYVGPVTELVDLYAKYPLGGKYGMFALVINARKFAMWVRETNTWEFMN